MSSGDEGRRKQTSAWNAALHGPALVNQAPKSRWLPADEPASVKGQANAVSEAIRESTRPGRETPANTPRRSGQIIGERYRLHHQFSRGEETEAWAAEHVELGRPVVVKFVHSLDPGVTERLLQQARILARIRHPHVAEYSDFGRTDTGDAFFVMEQLAGRSLQAMLELGGGLPWPRAVAIVQQLADALAAGHAQGVVHRDLRPANVFLIDGTGTDFVKLLDFGLSSDPDPNRISASTAGFASPEQATGSLLDPRSDVYSLGCLLFALIAGDPPFVGPAPHVLWAQVHTPPRSLRERAPRQYLPDELLGILDRCLDKLPARRFADTREVGAALAQFARLAPSAGSRSLAVGPPSVMGFANRPAPKDSDELDHIVRTGQTRSVPVLPPDESTSTMTIVGIALAVALAVMGGGVGVYWLVHSLIAEPDREPTPQVERGSEPPGTPSTPNAGPPAADPIEPVRGAEPADAVPPTASGASAASSAPAEPPPPAAPEKAKRGPEAGPKESDAPTPKPDVDPSPSKQSKPTTKPDSKANDHIGHDELLDPWG